MPKNQVKKDYKNFVNLGWYGSNNELTCGTSSEFLTSEECPSMLIPAIKTVKEYNLFNGENVAKHLPKIEKDVSGIQFGAEGSPVIYAHLPYWENQKCIGTNEKKKFSAKEREQMAMRIMKVGKELMDASEVSYDKEWNKVRLWWD